MKKVVAFTCLLAAPLAVAGVAGAGGDPGVLTLFPDTVDVSGSFEAEFDGCAPGDLVEFNIEDVDAGTATCDASGTALASLTAPSSPGTYEVLAGSTESNGATANLLVQMPSTGPESATTIALIGGAVLAVGVGLAGAARLRRRSI